MERKKRVMPHIRSEAENVRYHSVSAAERSSTKRFFATLKYAFFRDF